MELDHAVWLLAGIAVGLVAAMLMLAAMMALDYRHVRRHRRMRVPVAASPPAPDAAPAAPVAETAPLTVAPTGTRPVAPPQDPTSQPETTPQPAVPEPVPKEEGQGPPTARVDVPALFEQAFTGAKPATAIGASSGPGAPGAASGTADKI